MARIERSNEKYNRALVKELMRLDKLPPEATFTDGDEMLRWLNDERYPERL